MSPASSAARPCARVRSKAPGAPASGTPRTRRRPARVPGNQRWRARPHRGTPAPAGRDRGSRWVCARSSRRSYHALLRIALSPLVTLEPRADGLLRRWRLSVLRRFLRTLLVWLHRGANHDELVEHVEPEGRTEGDGERGEQPARKVTRDLPRRARGDALVVTLVRRGWQRPRPADWEPHGREVVIPRLHVGFPKVLVVGDRLGFGDNRLAEGIILDERLGDGQRVGVHR